MDENWKPDPALVFAVRARVVPISTLSGPDRAWVVASLTVYGWTVAAIADRLKCSLRLIQQIKAEPMTKVALYAIEREAELLRERGCRRLEHTIAAQEISALQARIARVTMQRDAMLDHLVHRKEMSDEPSAAPNPRRQSMLEVQRAARSAGQ